MKEIYFITNGMDGGGAERVMTILANYLVERGWKAAFLILQKHAGTYSLHPAVQCICKEDVRAGDARGQISFIRSHMKAAPGATFVSFFTHQNLYTILASMGLPVKVVVSERNDPKHSIHGSAKKLLRQILYSSPMCRKVVFQTRGAEDCFIKTIRKKGAVIPNPLKEGLPEGHPGARQKAIVSFGRLEPQKNYKLLLDAYAAFSGVYRDYDLYLYGQGSMEAALKAQAISAGIAHKVHFCGFCADVHEKVRDAAMFVLPSDYEGLSNAMLEALALGLPCICTDCPPGGARMYIQNGKNGLLTPVNDARAMAEAMCFIAGHPGEAERMGRNAAAIRELLHKDLICAAWEKELVNG